MHVKVCGITHLSDALMSIEQGADMLGFNFYTQSPRCISKEKAKLIIHKLPEKIIKVGIFIEYSYQIISKIRDDLGLDFVQIYAPMKDADKAFNARAILALNITSKNELPPHAHLTEYGYLLLDAPKTFDGVMGGTGRLADWALAAQLARHYRLFLAGGLTASNVRAAIMQVNPYAIDVASGVERAPGLKDYLKMKRFFEECKYDN